MKKLITILTLTLAGAFAFAAAPTDAEKAAFESYVKANVKGGEQFVETTEAAAKSDAVKAIAAWAQEDPEGFQEYLKGIAYVKGFPGGAYYWTVRKAVNKEFEPFSIQDAGINDFSATFDAVYNSESDYEKLRNAGFKIGSLRMGNSAIFILTCKRYSDPQLAMQLLPASEIAKNFGDFVKAINRANLDAKSLYELYSKVVKDFAQYKDSVKAVSDNWQALQTDKNEAFMNYYAEKKLEALEK